MPGEATTTREIWMNVHCDLQYAGRIQAVTRYLSALFAADPAMQVAETVDAGPIARRLQACEMRSPLAHLATRA